MQCAQVNLLPAITPNGSFKHAITLNQFLFVNIFHTNRFQSPPNHLLTLFLSLGGKSFDPFFVLMTTVQLRRLRSKNWETMFFKHASVRQAQSHLLHWSIEAKTLETLVEVAPELGAITLKGLNQELKLIGQWKVGLKS